MLLVFLIAATTDAPHVAATALSVWKQATCLLTHTAKMTPPSYTRIIPPPAVVRGTHKY